MGDWLGTGRVHTHKRTHLPFKEARDFVHKLGLKHVKEWPLFVKNKIPGKPKKPDTIPAVPDKVYKSQGWNGWNDWFGNGFAPKKRKKA